MTTCQQYDYIEIACMYKFPIKLIFKNGAKTEGIAYDTKINNNREECLVLKTADMQKLIVMNKIKEIRVKIENPHFKLVKFD